VVNVPGCSELLVKTLVIVTVSVCVDVGARIVVVPRDSELLVDTRVDDKVSVWIEAG
jgi:hypothetical protein